MARSGIRATTSTATQTIRSGLSVLSSGVLTADDQYGRRRASTEPSAVAPGQTQQTRQKTEFDPALPRSVLCLATPSILVISLTNTITPPHRSLRTWIDLRKFQLINFEAKLFSAGICGGWRGQAAPPELGRGSFPTRQLSAQRLSRGVVPDVE